MNAGAPMLRRRTRPGHCPVPGHGSRCEVSQEVDWLDRAWERRAVAAEIADGIAEWVQSHA